MLLVQYKHKLKISDTLNAEKSRSLVGINCYSLQSRAQTFCEENFLLKGNISFGDRYKILQKKDAETFSSSYVYVYLYIWKVITLWRGNVTVDEGEQYWVHFEPYYRSRGGAMFTKSLPVNRNGWVDTLPNCSRGHVQVVLEGERGTPGRGRGGQSVL